MARKHTRMFNETLETEITNRTGLLHFLFSAVGDGIFIESIFRCDYGYDIETGQNYDIKSMQAQSI